MTGLVVFAVCFFRGKSAVFPFFNEILCFAALSNLLGFFLFVTFTRITVLAPPSCAAAVIFAVPGRIALITPFEVMDATLFLLDV